MRFVLLVSAASLVTGVAFGQTMLGQSQPGSASSLPTVSVPAPPPVVPAPAAPVAPTQAESPPPPGLVQTPLPPPGAAQPESAPPDNAAVAQSSPPPQPVAQPMPSQAVSPAAPAATGGNPQSASMAGATAPMAPASMPMGPTPLPSNDVPPTPDNKWVYGHVAELGVLNKVDGSTTTLKVPVGERGGLCYPSPGYAAEYSGFSNVAAKQRIVFRQRDLPWLDRKIAAGIIRR